MSVPRSDFNTLIGHKNNVPLHTAINCHLLQFARTCSRTVFPARCSEMACLSALTLRPHCKFC